MTPLCLNKVSTCAGNLTAQWIQLTKNILFWIATNVLALQNAILKMISVCIYQTKRSNFLTIQYTKIKRNLSNTSPVFLLVLLHFVPTTSTAHCSKTLSTLSSTLSKTINLRLNQRASLFSRSAQNHNIWYSSLIKINLMFKFAILI